MRCRATLCRYVLLAAPLAGMMSKAQPQIVTNAQRKGVKLIGFEQLQQ
jgi:hypothetical protein